MSGIIVNTNLPSMMVQRNLNTATDNLNKSIERMTTGLKINRAADDAAGLYVANGLEKQVRGSEICESNIQTGINILQIAEGDLSLIQEHVLRIRDLAVQAASDYYTTDARNAMADEAKARYAEIDRLAAASNFNGLNLLDGTLDDGTSADRGLRLQVGPDSPATTNAITVTDVFKSATGADLNLAANAAAVGTAFASASSAATFITNCDTALTNVNNRRAAIGAVQNRLESAYDSLTVGVENLSAARSTIMDADIAKESSEYTKQQILQQASASLLVQANQAPSIALNLI